MHLPPSTSNIDPVIMLASSEQRKQAALPKSLGVENLPIGIVDKKAFLLSGVSSPKKELSSGVSPATGASEFTLTL